MHRERLERLVTLLEGLPDEGFDLSEFVAFDPNDTLECQTVACALGWAAMDPWFNEQGLKVATHAVPRTAREGLLEPAQVQGCIDAARERGEFQPFGVGYLTPAGTLRRGFAAAEEFFDLAPDLVELLFSRGWNYDTREDVIARLKAVLAGNFRPDRFS